METFISLPFRIDRGSGGVATSTSVSQKYKQFIANVLLTSINERVMRPSYGSRIGQYNFSSVQPDNSIDQYVREAIATWVPDVTVDSVIDTLDVDSGKIQINITYTLPDNSSQNLLLVQDNIGDVGDGDISDSTKFVVKTEQPFGGSYRTQVVLPSGQVVYE